LEGFLNSAQINFQQLKFSDHQFIGNQELEKITGIYSDMQGEKKLILTTEKDYVRSFLKTALPIYYLPIKTEIIGDSEEFNDLIKKYVRKN
jgi:tetraacyldisaccharide 4'-kinase